MKSFQKILKDNDCIVHADGNIFITNEAKLERVINEVISQRLGEPVAWMLENAILPNGTVENSVQLDRPDVPWKSAYKPLYALNIER